MDEPRGLRERKRQRTHDALSEAAISLFLRHGYDQVSVADVAAAAEVSKPTLFKYFPSKEDLVLHRILDHRGEAARVVRDRSPGEAPLAALRRHFLAGLDRRDPVTGLNDHPEVLAFHGMVFGTPSLAARVAQYATHDEEALAEALAEAAPAADALDARLAASQIVAVQRVLARENWRRLTEGRTAAEVHADAVTAADHAFDLLAGGLTGYAEPGGARTDDVGPPGRPTGGR
ncbi:TetR/AcrR family transcriptional regulator [Plantactinospora solaniradicis]|uniref:TetR/AcrR family transcriptional regulator n=1 Tax=Plantactinospora solaniradicis TaxID=1723736 RepID=A0ABW1KE12_9ACTN